MTPTPEDLGKPRCSYCDDTPEASLVRVQCNTCRFDGMDCQQCVYRHIEHDHTLELVEGSYAD